MRRPEDFDATHDEIVAALNLIGSWTTSPRGDRLAGLAAGLEEESPPLTAGEIQAMTAACRTTWKSRFMPPLSVLRDFARPPRQAHPDEQRESQDPVIALERERSVLISWQRHYDQRDDQERVAMIRRDRQRLEDHINRRLQERGLSPRYTESGAEVWSGGI